MGAQEASYRNRLAGDHGSCSRPGALGRAHPCRSRTDCAPSVTWEYALPSGQSELLQFAGTASRTSAFRVAIMRGVRVALRPIGSADLERVGRRVVAVNIGWRQSCRGRATSPVLPRGLQRSSPRLPTALKVGGWVHLRVAGLSSSASTVHFCVLALHRFLFPLVRPAVGPRV